MNIITKSIILLLIIILLISFVRNVTIYSRSRQFFSQSKDELIGLEVNNKKLETEIDMINNDFYLEKMARDKLFLSKEGETVVILPSDDVLKKLSVPLIKEEDKKEIPNWKKWLIVFGFVEG